MPLMATKRMKARRIKEFRLRGTRIPVVGDRFVMFRVEAGRVRRSSARHAEGAATIVPKAARALDKPGIRKDAVFTGRSNRVFAYSVDDKDPRKLVRESADGKRSVGRLVGGRFRAG